MGFLSNKIDRKQLKAGDHIYSWRQAYLFAHHGIYVGEGMVIHFTDGTPSVFNRFLTSSVPSCNTDIPCPSCGVGGQTRTHSVFSSCLDCFLSGGELYLFQYGVYKLHFLAQVRGGTCTLASSDPTEEVLHRALYLFENNGFGDYHVSDNNCEDFAIYCKTGLLVTMNSSVGGSGQTSSYLAGAKSIASIALRYVAPPGCQTLVDCGKYCYRRVVSDIGYRRTGVTKVPVEKIPEIMMARGRI